MPRRPRQGSLFELPPPAAGKPARKPKPKRRSHPRASANHAAGQGQFAAVAQVALAAHTGLLTYGVPAALVDRVVPGARVLVPIQKRVQQGVVWQVLALAQSPLPIQRLRPVAACPEDAAPLPVDLVETLGFVARYYQAPLGDALRLALPAPVRRTGLDGDAAPEKLQWVIEPTYVRPWPDGLTRAETRLLARIEAAGATPVSSLRRASRSDVEPAPGTAPDLHLRGDRGKADLRPKRAVAAPQAVLESLAARGLCRLWQERVLRDPLGMQQPVPPDVPPHLTPEQALAFQRMRQDVVAQRYTGHLLRGVTGSGKTEVYLRLIAEALQRGRGAIVLVPEIALTPQLVQRFRARFGDAVAALHSGLSEGERLDQWTRIERGERRIVVGPRSALFAPVQDLGVIVVDECHDASFKQQAGLRYHARDVALVRARAAKAVAVLGSATPGCEEMALAHEGRLTLTELAHRPLGGTLPLASVVNLRDVEKARDPANDRPSLLSLPLVDAVREVVRRGEQAMLLHNRRGFAPTMICMGCGHAVECVECAVALTLHRAQGRLRCHLCDFSLAADTSCPSCKGSHLVGVGAGTERIETTLQLHLPHARIARFDRDTATGRRLHDTLQRFARRELDVLVGTQMLAKGHDFPAVTLVGVVLAEQGLRVPDFRAAERTFQLLTQVAGRAGRGDRPGKVIVQTYLPHHPAVAAALRHDHAGFLQSELGDRHAHRWPPYTFLALVETRHPDQGRARAVMADAADYLRSAGLEVRGPFMAGIPRVRGVYRVHALCRSDERGPLHEALRNLRRAVLDPVHDVAWSVDVDPMGFG